MNKHHADLLHSLCKIIYQAQEAAELDYRREAGLEHVVELLIIRRDKISIEIRAEDVSHNEPHLHITHSDKIDVSLSLNDFRVLAGEIDRKTLKHLKPVLLKCQPHLLNIWKALNETGNAAEAHRIISNLDFK